jgi:hypothetical protein
MVANPASHRPRKNTRHNTFFLLSAIALLAVIVGLTCAWLMLQAVEGYYAQRIYPNVYSMGVRLGQLTPAEARATLEQNAHLADSGQLVLRDGEQLWAVPWSEAGMSLDVTATSQAAFAVGHASSGQRLRERVRVWLRRHDVAPVMSVDEAQAREVLERLAPSLALSPTEATLFLDGEQVSVQPGQPGRVLDVEATLAQLLTSAAGPVDLVFRVIPPQAVDAAPLQARAQELLARRVELRAWDVLSDEDFSWTLGRSDIASWLRIEAADLSLDEEAVQATLAGLAAGLGQGRGLRLPEAAGQVLAALESGGGTVDLYLTHPTRAYVVQAGDTVSSIASAFGMPAWPIMQANPGANLDWLHVGQELTIPSQDVLTPLKPVPGKKAVVSIDEQRLRVYENGALLYDWPISTGIDSSPTSVGVFQVLEKQENAYASLWDLWMPHFMSIYPAGPDFYNGFHGLPTLSSGRTLWAGLLGSPASYGCIILGLEEAEIFYNWAEIGVVVVVQ